MVENTRQFLTHAVRDEMVGVHVQTDLADAASGNTTMNNDKVLCVSGFGHMGDGNLHLNVLLRNQSTKQRNENSEATTILQIKKHLNKFVYDRCIQMKGSISAEHGIGVQKKAYMQAAHSPELVRQMQLLKSLFDPKNTLNPGKVLPDKSV